MPRSAAKFLGPLAGLLLVLHGFFAVRGFAQTASPTPGWCRLDELGLDILIVLLIAVGGRVLLAWLPPGPQGSHTPRHLPVTCAVSYLLGLAVFAVEFSGLRILLPGAGRALQAALLGAPFLLLGVLRVLTLPGAMVPRHDPRRARAGPVAVALYALAVVWMATKLGQSDDYLAQNLGWCGLWILIAHGLGQARRAPAGVAVVVVVGLLTSRHADISLTAVFFGTGAAFLVGWLRRADQRACWLAAIAFASCSLSGAPTLALAGLTTLVLGSWPGQRGYAAIAALAGGVLLGVTGFFATGAQAWFQGSYLWSPERADITALFQRAFDLGQWGSVWYLFAATLVAGTILRFRSPTVAREQLALMLLFVLGCLSLFPLPWSWTNHAILPSVFPVTILLAGLVWVPEDEDER